MPNFEDLEWWGHAGLGAFLGAALFAVAYEMFNDDEEESLGSPNSPEETIDHPLDLY